VGDDVQLVLDEFSIERVNEDLLVSLAFNRDSCLFARDVGREDLECN
jgi:hypothetical protein